SPPFRVPRSFSLDTATTVLSTLSLHDALPISRQCLGADPCPPALRPADPEDGLGRLPNSASCDDRRLPRRRHDEDREQDRGEQRSEEHTSELQSRGHLVCRLLLEKKNQKRNAA